MFISPRQAVDLLLPHGVAVTPATVRRWVDEGRIALPRSPRGEVLIDPTRDVPRLVRVARERRTARLAALAAARAARSEKARG